VNLIRGQSANEVWQRAQELLRSEVDAGLPQASRAGVTFELLHVAMEIEDPRQRWVAARQPPINPAFAIAEVIWILAGSNESAILNYWFPRLPQFSGEGPTYAGAYGYRLRRHFGIDQVKRACEILTANPDSRQVVMQLWDAKEDLPNRLGEPPSQDIPCNIVSLLKLRNNRLDWTQVMRSNDLYRGLPYNLVQFTTLQEVMAGWLNVKLGSYHHWSDSLHAYEADVEKFVSAEDSCEPNTDCLAMPMDQGERLTAELFARLQALTQPTLSEKNVAELALLQDAPSAYRNLLAILAAESARKRRFIDLTESLAASCANPQLFQAWNRWNSWVTNANRIPVQ